MRILVVGSGGREHALAWKLAQSDHVDAIASLPGSPGMAALGGLVAADPLNFDAVVAAAEEHKADLVVVGPEAPLVAGLADHLSDRGVRVFGPTKAAAEIEGSKIFCRQLALRYGVPVAEGETFDDPDTAYDFAKTIAPPVVVKAEGLAAGKGVVICEDHDAARAAIDRVLRERAFGAGGVIVEEFLEGRETSIFCVTDGTTKLILEPAQDYKRALDDDRGLNTGGMGSYSPVPWLEPSVRDEAVRRIIAPLLEGLAEQRRPYRGCFYAGLMITDKGPYLIEVNCRFGDPETQVLMPRMGSDLAELLLACEEGSLDRYTLRWRDEACVCVVVASGGYPGDYETGVPIEGIEEAESDEGVAVFHAGTGMRDGRLVSAGGRVLNVSALGSSIADARDRAYRAVASIRMDGAQHRSDIARI